MSGLFTVDHSAAGGSFDPLPIQEYECVISEVKVGKSKGDKTSGCDQLELVLTVRDDIDQPGKKRKFFDTIIFAPSLAWKIQQFFKAMDFPNGTNFKDITDIARQVAYKSVRLKNKHDTYQKPGEEPKTRDKVDFYTVSKSPLAAVAGGTDPFAAGGAGADPFAAAQSADDDDVPF